jgi:DNA-binding CsgD family transcriptional regulator
MIDAIALGADKVKTVDEFKKWTRTRIRPVFPHETLCSGYAHLHAGGVEPDYLVTVDAPAGYFEEALRNRAGAIDTPILRRWLAVREPQLFELDRPWPDVPGLWLESFRSHGLQNVAAHGVEDIERCHGTYHCFYRIPGRLGAAHVEALKQLVPVMHEALCRVIALLNSASEFAARLAGLSRREKEIVRWVKLGKTNSEVAKVSGLSENTVKHHLTRIFGKLAVDTRVQLLHRLAEDEARVAATSGPKIL